jgi:mono/diheme cytochrome c family protein
MIDSRPAKKPPPRPIKATTSSSNNQPSFWKLKYDKHQHGKTLFLNICAACHNKNMKDDLTGPALDDVMLRWENDTTALLNYLKNAGEYFSGQPSKRMMELHNQFGNFKKPSFEELSLEDVKSILSYIEGEPSNKTVN